MGFSIDSPDPIDRKLIDLALIIIKELPELEPREVLSKMRDLETWKSFIITTNGQVLGGYVLCEHQNKISIAGCKQNIVAELSLIAVKSES